MEISYTACGDLSSQYDMYINVRICPYLQYVPSVKVLVIEVKDKASNTSFPYVYVNERRL